MKTCTECKIEKPLTGFNKKSATRDGLSSHCRECENKKKRAYNARPDVAENRRKTRNKWYNDLPPAVKEKTQAQSREYHKENKEHLRACQKQYYFDNRRESLARSRKYYLVNREARRSQAKQYYLENRDEILARNKAYTKANPDKVGATSAAKRSRRRAAETDNHTIAELHEYWRNKGLDPQICAYCDNEIGSYWRRSEGDHIFPLVKGGKDVLENLNPCCKTCNSSKRSAILYEEWIPPNERTQQNCNKTPVESGQ